ncbi:hypothetical protein ACP275_14G224200 [Erythranthe tilingii]
MERKLKRERVRESGGDSRVSEDETNELTQEGDSVSKRRTIRSKYRLIEHRINERKDEIANVDSQKFMAIMKEVENIHQHVQKPREQVADAEAFLGLASILVDSVKSHTSGGVSPAEFVSSLIKNFGLKNPTKGTLDNSPNILWQTMGSLVSPIFLNGPGCITMIGPMKNELKPRKLSVRAKRSRSVVNARPNEIEKEAKVVAETDTNMHLMFEILKKEKKVKVENLMLNRNSFAQTVENLFALSFLVRDGRVIINVDETGSQVVVPANGPSAEEIKSGVAKTRQFVFRFDFDDWKLMKSIVPEGDERMPKRDASTNADYARAKPETGDESFSPTVAFLSDPEFIPTAVVKKFLRNSGRTMQHSCVTDDGDFGARKS